MLLLAELTYNTPRTEQNMGHVVNATRELANQVRYELAASDVERLPEFSAVGGVRR